MNIYSLFIFNFFINSLLVFITIWSLVELFLFILRIKSFRVKYFARLLPIIKVFFDIGIYSFSSWAILQNINPLLCEKGSRTLSISLTNFSGLTYFFKILMHLPNKLTFTISDILSSVIGMKCTNLITTIIIIGCFIGLVRFFYAIISSKNINKKVLKNFTEIESKILKRLIQNKSISRKVIFGIIPLDISPCVIKNQKKWHIVFPKSFEKFLTDKEVKSILEHEIQHIINLDYYFSIIYSFLQIFHWHNPLILLWKKKMTLTGELACDQNIKNHPIHLATALKKLATKKHDKLISTHAFFNKNTLLIRMKNLTMNKQKAPCKWIQYGALMLISIFLLFSKLWIF